MKVSLLIIFLFLSKSLFAMNIKSIKSDSLPDNKQNWENFPFQFGIDGGFAIPIKGKNYVTSGFFAHLNINLYKRIIFLKLEGGKNFVNSNINFNYKGYLSIGVEWIFYKIDTKNKLGIEVGIGGNGAGGYLVAGWKAGILYKHSFNKFWGVYSSIKIPVINSNNRDEYYFNPLLTVGVHFF